MKRILLGLSGALALWVPVTAMAQLDSLVAGNTAFALRLYSQLATNAGNIFFSPYSISTCLGMLYAGARGNTQQQMSQVLGFSTNQQQFASLFGRLPAELEADQQINALELNIANALWIQEGIPFLPAFLETATNQYQAGFGQVDFTSPADDVAVTQTINNWVAQKTRNIIQGILPSGAINTSTRVVLANAIYFQGTWTYAFEDTNTTTQPFYLSSASLVDAPLMHLPLMWGPAGVIPATFNYMETNDFQALELSYGTNGTVSMVILLPWQVDGLGRLEQQLSPAFLSSVLAQMTMQNVEIFLPRFTNESYFDLIGNLAAMGMPEAFEPGVADFSGIDGTNDLFVTFALHRAWGQVGEAGTQAAAATIGGGAQGGGIFNPHWAVFRADHPFLFFIRDTQTGSMLFMGRLANPSPSATPTPMPQLGSSRSANRLTISWPYPSTSWTLEQNTDLATTNWVSSGGVSNDGTNNYLTAANPGNLFFRLSLTLGSQPLAQ